LSVMARADRVVRERRMTSCCRCCSSSSQTGMRRRELDELMQERALDP
jgi:hypothetical protein